MTEIATPSAISTFDTLAVDVGFTEGPVWMQNGDLVFVSISQGRLYRIAPNGLTVAGTPGGGPNGAAEGPNGIVYIAQNSGVYPGSKTVGVTGGVQAVHPDGRVETITEDPIFPNDLCFGPDGKLYVTDPTRNDARDDGRLWRIDVETGATELLGSVGWYPNGIGFAADTDDLFVAQGGQGRILRIPLEGKRLGEPSLQVQLVHGRPDGFAWDAEGYLLIGAITGTQPGDVQVYNPAGELVEILRPGEGTKYTNLAISPSGQLAVTDSDKGAVISTQWRAPGLALHPFRK